MNDRAGLFDVVMGDREPPVLSCMPYLRGKLDRTEALCLAHVASGLTDEETAVVLGAGVGIVRWAIRSAVSKLGARNRPHAVARAILLGYLGLEDALSKQEGGEESSG